jgi:hypothetical protein
MELTQNTRENPRRLRLSQRSPQPGRQGPCSLAPAHPPQDEPSARSRDAALAHQNGLRRRGTASGCWLVPRTPGGRTQSVNATWDITAGALWQVCDEHCPRVDSARRWTKLSSPRFQATHSAGRTWQRVPRGPEQDSAGLFYCHAAGYETEEPSTTAMAHPKPPTTPAYTAQLTRKALLRSDRRRLQTMTRPPSGAAWCHVSASATSRDSPIWAEWVTSSGRWMPSP